MKCAVIGGGIGGLSAGLELSRRGHAVHVFETTPRLGGVATTVRVPGGRMEGTYHHIFMSDDPIRNLVRDIASRGQTGLECFSDGFFRQR